MKFSELIRLLERHGFTLLREKGSIRYYSKPGHDKVVRVDDHGSKEVPTGTWFSDSWNSIRRSFSSRLEPVQIELHTEYATR